MNKLFFFILLGAFQISFCAISSEASTDTTIQIAPAPLDLEGLDTIEDAEGGNWYEKRVLLKKARPKYDAIKKIVDSFDKIKKQFLESRAGTAKTLADFYIDLGFEKAKIDEKLDELNSKIEAERQREGLTEEERKILQELIENKTDLENLKKDLELVKQLESNLDSGILKLEDQIEIARNYETDSWKAYQSIADVLDDQKARNYYMQIKANLDNVQAIERYINSQFQTYFNQTNSVLVSEMDKVKSEISKLAEAGIGLTKEFEDAQKAQEVTKAAQRKALEEKEKQLKAKVQKGFFEYVIEFFKNLMSGIWKIIIYPFEFVKNIFTKSKMGEKQLPIPGKFISTNT